MNILTNHFVEKSNSRNISLSDIESCISYGELLHKTGIKFHILSKKNIIRNHLSEKLEGLCVLVTNDNIVITTYKNKNSISNTKRLSKNNLKKFFN